MHWTSWGIIKQHVENFHIFITERVWPPGHNTQYKHLDKSYGRLENTRLYTDMVHYVSPHSGTMLHVHLQTHLNQHETSSHYLSGMHVT